MLQTKASAVGAALLYFAALLLPNAVLVAVAPSPWSTASTTLAAAIAGIAILWAACRRHWVVIAATLAAVLFWPVEIYYSLVYREPLSAYVLGSILETNPSEAMAFMTGLGGVLVAAWLGMGLLGGAALWLARRQRIEWRGRTRGWVLVGALALFGVIATRTVAEAAADAVPLDVGSAP
jgi:hypothetical protein